jgi:DNA-binding SARP family transcriptional activator
MPTFWLTMGAVLIGLPGAVLIVLQLIAQHRKQMLTYEWSAQEVIRRGQRLDELDKLARTAQQRITELNKQKSELQAAISKLEKLASKAIEKETNIKTFSVGIYNSEVRRAHMMGEKHRQLDDKWGEINYLELKATSEDEVRRTFMRKFPPERGFVIESVQEVKK